MFEATTGPDEIGGEPVPAGARTRVEIPAARIATGEWLHLVVEVLRGTRPGPTVWLSGAIHGDEPIGVEIIRQAMERLDPARLSGTVLAVPIVNVFGFVAQDRYLPDRRDLNRSFPGSKRGSLASQLASLFMREIVQRCDFGVDIHCGSLDRTNFPNVRGDLDDPATYAMAKAFGAPVMIHSRPPKGSLRQAAARAGARVLLFEGGEANRFDELAVREGVDGILRCLYALGMTEEAPSKPLRPVAESRKTFWLRAPRGGIFRPNAALGSRVESGEAVGFITDIRGDERVPVKATKPGLVFGLRLAPLVHRGDAVAHLADLSR